MSLGMFGECRMPCFPSSATSLPELLHASEMYDGIENKVGY
jgi:hypothetical protein